MSNNQRSQVLFNNQYSSVSDHEIKSIVELCREDLSDMTNVILSECSISLGHKKDQVKHLSPLTGVSIYENHCYIFDEYYLCVGFDYCSIFSYLLLADCCFKDTIVAEVFSQTQDYLYYVEVVRDDLLLCEYIPNKDILQSDRAIISSSNCQTFINTFNSYFINVGQVSDFQESLSVNSFKPYNQKNELECRICPRPVINGIQCETCRGQFHRGCLRLSATKFNRLLKSRRWNCDSCQNSEDTIKKDEPSLYNHTDQSRCVTPPLSKDKKGNSEVLSAFLNRIRPHTRQNHPSPMINTTMEGTDDDLNCPLCNTTTENQFQTILCDGCDHWYHTDCVDLSKLDVKRLIGKDWYCSSCTKNTTSTPICPFKAKAVPASTTTKLPSVNFDPEPSTSGRSSKRKRGRARKDKLKAGEVLGDICPECKDEVSSEEDNLLCSCCNKKNHRICLSLNNEKYLALVASSDDWFCKDCIAKQYKGTTDETVTWGSMTGLKEIRSNIDKLYLEIISWQKNLFLLPRGKVGKEFLSELTRLINLFNRKTVWSDVALSLVHIFIPFMLQKPSIKSKAKNNGKYLAKRLEWWKNGNLELLLNECSEVQSRLRKNTEGEAQGKRKAFCRLMLQGKISKALKYIDNSTDATLGVHSINDEIISTLQEKHPDPGPVTEEALLPKAPETPEEVIFEPIDAEKIIRATRKINGSGGPTQVDADNWKHMLCSKFFTTQSESLAQAIADLTKILCTEEVNAECVKELYAGRLIPLDKGNGGVRPIGIGEVLRRIISKSVTSTLKEDIISAAGLLQTCSGLEGGIEAAIHAMSRAFSLSETEALLLVDADNAFNSINRKVALHNVQRICPSFYRFLFNSYQVPVKLFISGSRKFIWSKEGATQGDPAAMAFYALATRPLMDVLSKIGKIIQSWYADDTAACSSLVELKSWWDKLCAIGPTYGYFPKPSKTILVVKNGFNLPMARSLFEKTGVTISLQGERHLGAVIGSKDFKEQYVRNKVSGWVKDVEELSEIGKDEPQLAYNAYIKGLSHRWTYVQRTISDTSELFKPLERAISERLIPSILGREISVPDREMLALPLRAGGLGIENPVQTADSEYKASTAISSKFSELILLQEQDTAKLDRETIKVKKVAIKQAKELELKAQLQQISDRSSLIKQKIILLNCEKGASSWLSALPLKCLGYCLNKQEFRDSICLRYGWSIPNVPRFCVCGKKNDIDHSLSCKRGPYVNFRHNAIRDAYAEILKDICIDVRTEPGLLPVNPDTLCSTAIASDQARLDIVATGLWAPFERTYFDVRITHPTAPSNVTLTLAQLYHRNEREKKTKYGERVRESEKASFVPLVFTTSGGMAPECAAFMKQVALRLADKRKDDYAAVANYIRTKIRFALLKSVLISLRGVRGKQRKDAALPTSAVDFGLIPECDAYEAY